MKKIALIYSILFFFFGESQAQLVNLFSIKSERDEQIGDLYKKYKFSIVLDNNLYALKSMDGKSYYFKPEKRIFYEVYKDKWVLVSEIDTSVVKKRLPTPAFFFPRNKVYVLPIKNLEEGKRYFVDFMGKIVAENQAVKNYDDKYYLIKKIDFEKMQMIIYDPKKKIKEILQIKEETN